MTYLFHISNLKGYLANFKKQEIFIVIFYWMRTSKQDPGIISQVQMKMKPIKNYQPVCSKGRILARMHVLGPPLDSLDPLVEHLKLTNGSVQNFMDPRQRNA